MCVSMIIIIIIYNDNINSSSSSSNNNNNNDNNSNNKSNNYKCSRKSLRESSNAQSISVQVLKRFVLTVAVVTVCWPYDNTNTEE